MSEAEKREILASWDTLKVSHERGGATTVFVSRTSGPPLLLLHELPGMTPAFLRFAKRLEKEQFRLYMPLLFGEAGEQMSDSRMAMVALRRDINALAKDEVSPMIRTVRDVLAIAHQRENGRALGVIGMCLTGNFIIPLLSDSRVASGVMAQPALPLPWGAARKRALGVSKADIDAARRSQKKIFVVHFTEDRRSRKERYATLRAAFDGQIEVMDIDSTPGNPDGLPSEAHAVLTEWYSDNPAHSTNAAFRRVVRFLRDTVH